jgi:PPK2 family polyphosphate:nucleotide phosphotransferase
MITPISGPYLVPFEPQHMPEAFATSPPEGAPGKKGCKAALGKEVKRLDELQRRLYAEDRRSLLLIFQAMDAAGKDSTIRAVMKGVDPSGCQVFSFKQPSPEELEHDFLWRTTCRLPERGRIGIFNRSYYEETLVVRVHPDYLQAQRIHIPDNLEELWQRRFEAIRQHEKHLAESGTVILKFWLNVSPQAQRERFISRLEEPQKHWKFSLRDVEERQHWDSYMHAYRQALAETSRPWAPWYAIPADDKPFMRWQVAKLVRETLQRMDPRYPEIDAKAVDEFVAMRQRLKHENS